MSYNQTPYDIKQTLKQGLIYLLIALPFVAIVAVLLTIIKAPVGVVMLCNIITGGIVVFVAYVIHNNIKEKRKQKQKDQPKKFDPFKD